LLNSVKENTKLVWGKLSLDLCHELFSKQMIVFPNAKINIGLAITEKRADGFHNIESCFYPVGWTDALEVLPAAAFSFRSSGLPIPGSGNLCTKAYELLKADYDLAPVDIHLLKSIPIGAGLGGGSADAAFTITALNNFFNIGLSEEEQRNYARKLGSDCAFFITNKPTFCFGKGDEFSETDVSLTGKQIVLVYPNLHISTAEAYAGVKPHRPDTDLNVALTQPLATWKDTIFNDFENSLFPRYPVLNKLKNDLYDQGAIYASMTGSGSTIYGIFEKDLQLSNKFADFTVWKGDLN
jgi:4-diphosphocytidyl-2-C-methyl-D-erythritol kinase